MVKNLMKNVNIGQLVREILDNKRIKVCTLSEKLNVRPTAVSRMLNHSVMSTEKLMKISSILDYNFYRRLGELIDISEPANEAFETYKEQTQQQIAGLEKALASSEKENKLLRKVVDAMTEKKK